MESPCRTLLCVTLKKFEIKNMKIKSKVVNLFDKEAYECGLSASGLNSNANPYFLIDPWKSLSWHEGWKEANFKDFEISKMPSNHDVKNVNDAA